MAKKLYAPAALKLVTGLIDLDNDTIKCLAIASNGAFDPAGAEYDGLDDAALAAGITSYECNATNYARQTLSNITVALTGGTLPVKFDADDITITSLGADGTHPIEGWLVYVDGATDADRYPLVWLPYTSAQSPNGNDFVIQWNASGIITLDQAA